LLVAVLVGLVALVQARALGSYPAFFDDEGTYVSQAWAVDNLGTLAPYTYWYDHPPLGWLMLALWAQLAGSFSPEAHAVAEARVLMVLMVLAGAGCIYLIATRSGLRRRTAALAVLLFALSPLAVHYQRMVLLDNIAMGWLLAAFALALSPRRRLAAYAGAGLCFAAAILSKETFLLFAPALALLIWQRAAGRTRPFALGICGAMIVFAASFYPLFALLRGELLSGPGHTSLADGIGFQLFSRAGSGSVLDPHSGARQLVEDWLALDPVLLVAALPLIPVGLALRHLRPFALALAILVGMGLRPGGYLPAMYIIGILPFAALIVAGVADWLWRPWAAAENLDPTRSRLLACAGTLLACALVVGVAAAAVPRWVAGSDEQAATDLTRPSWEAVAWLDQHADRSSNLLVDNTIWTDLVERGFEVERTVWFFKLDLDPAVRFTPKDFDYVVLSNYMRGNLAMLPETREAVKRSTAVATFASGPERIEIRRVVP
jgi:4-amino-4-deoxy-L-arabinose transferase-like glycosyltransferase